MNSGSKRKRSQSLMQGSSEMEKKITSDRSDFVCPICFDMMEEPHVTKCGHTYCFQCITVSLVQKNSCPKCSSPVDGVFPNFLLSELITKHKQELLNRKQEAVSGKFPHPAPGSRQLSQIHELLEQTSDQMAISDLNYLILTLRRKKHTLEQTSAYVQNELLKEFLSQARRHKQDQMDQLTRQLNRIEGDVKRADEIAAALAASSDSHSLSLTSTSSSCSTDHKLVSSIRAQESVSDSSNPPVVQSSGDPVSQLPSGSRSSSINGSMTGNHNQDFSIHCLSPPSVLNQDCCQYTLSEKKIKMMAYFEVLEACYLNSRSENPAFAITSVPTSSSHPPAAATATNSSAAAAAESSNHSVSDDNIIIDSDDFAGLSEFSNTLNQFTSYNGLRPLATLCYTPDLFPGSSIVSSIEFDKENEYFAIAGVTKKIKLFDYASVISSNGCNDMHYPLVEMGCNSKISCVSWSSYMKSMMASSDYEGSVIVWDAFTAQKLRVFQEHEKRCWSVDFNKIDTKLIASGSDDAKVKLWSTNVQHSVATLAAKANVCCVKFNPSKRYHLAFGGADHSVHYYDLRNTKTAISVFKGHEKAVSYVKFLNESQLVSASTDSQLKLWSLTENHCVESFRGHINEKNFVGLATSGDFIACGSENNSLYVYFRGVPRHMLSFHFDSTPAAAIPSDTTDNKILGVDGKGKKEEDTSDFVSAVSWRTGTNVIAAANSQGMIKILELI